MNKSDYIQRMELLWWMTSDDKGKILEEVSG